MPRSLLFCVVVSVGWSWSLQASHARLRPRRSHEEDDPPEPLSNDELREFRARLIAREESSSDLDDEWAYETPLLEQGAVLLGGVQHDSAFALRQQYFHKCVVVLVQHDSTFTKGVIVNRPSQRTLDGWDVRLGGDVCEGGIFASHPTDDVSLDVECLTWRDDVPDATVVVKGLYRCTFDNAKKMVALGADKSDFWVFCGYAGWAPDQLAREVDGGSWYVAHANGAALVDDLRRCSSSPEKLDDGISTWDRLMVRIGRRKEIGRWQDRLSDKMLRVWLDSRLATPTNSAFDEDRADASLRWLLGPPDEAFNSTTSGDVVARGALLAGVAVGTDFVLDRQYLHKSLLIVVAATDDLVVVAALNRPTVRSVSLTIDEYSTATRRVGFGGELWARGAPSGILWVKVDGDEALAGPTAENRAEGTGPALLGPKDVAALLSTGQARIDNVVAISGITAWSTRDFYHYLGTGELIPLKHEGFPWKNVIDLQNTAPPDTGVKLVTIDDGTFVWESALLDARPADLLDGDDVAIPDSPPLADEAFGHFRDLHIL